MKKVRKGKKMLITTLIAIIAIVLIIVLIVVNVNKKKNNNTTNNQGNVNATANISVERAKEIALSHAGLASNQVTFQRTELDFDNGIQKYEIEFYYNYREYSYEIDANTGNILSYEQD